jgi:hypothetical protein
MRKGVVLVLLNIREKANQLVAMRYRSSVTPAELRQKLADL